MSSGFGREAHPWVVADPEAIRFGIFGGPMGDFPKLQDLVAEAEALGFDSFWIPDHPTLLPDWVTNLSALAVSTTRIRLGPLVASASFRSAAVLANQAADLDRLSDGRLVLGIGSGDMADEFQRLGIEFPSFAERHARTDETIRAMRELWSGEPITFDGAHVRLEGMTLPSLPVQRPWVPVLIGGGGERKTLRAVAELADASNFGAWEMVGGAKTQDDVRRKLAALRAHCEDIGRPYSNVLTSHVTLRMLLGDTASIVQEKVDGLPPGVFEQFAISQGLLGGAADARTYFQDLVDAGIRYFIVRIWEDDLDSLRILARQVIPTLRVA